MKPMVSVSFRWEPELWEAVRLVAGPQGMSGFVREAVAEKLDASNVPPPLRLEKGSEHGAVVEKVALAPVVQAQPVAAPVVSSPSVPVVVSPVPSAKGQDCPTGGGVFKGDPVGRCERCGYVLRDHRE